MLCSKGILSKDSSLSQGLQNIREELVGCASGIFIWVILVVQMLNKKCDRGCRIQGLDKMASDITKDLGQLFKGILAQGDDDKENTRLCLQWLFFSTRPLRREELYFAIRSGRDENVEALWDHKDNATKLMEAFILNSSKGLAELTESITVQFIHETIRDFLLYDGVEYIQGTTKDPFVGSGHDRLTRSCVNYISSARINLCAMIPLDALEIPTTPCSSSEISS